MSGEGEDPGTELAVREESGVVPGRAEVEAFLERELLPGFERRLADAHGDRVRGIRVRLGLLLVLLVGVLAVYPRGRLGRRPWARVSLRGLLGNLTDPFTPEVRARVERFGRVVEGGGGEVAHGALGEARAAADTAEEKAQVMRRGWETFYAAGAWRDLRRSTSEEVPPELATLARIQRAAATARQSVDALLAPRVTGAPPEEFHRVASEAHSLEVLHLRRARAQLADAMREEGLDAEDRAWAGLHLRLVDAFLRAPEEGGLLRATQALLDAGDLADPRLDVAGFGEKVLAYLARRIGAGAVATFPGPVWTALHSAASTAERVGPARLALLYALLVGRSLPGPAAEAAESFLRPGLLRAHELLGSPGIFAPTAMDPKVPARDRWDGGFAPGDAPRVLEALERRGMG